MAKKKKAGVLDQLRGAVKSYGKSVRGELGQIPQDMRRPLDVKVSGGGPIETLESLRRAVDSYGRSVHGELGQIPNDMRGDFGMPPLPVPMAQGSLTMRKAGISPEDMQAIAAARLPGISQPASMLDVPGVPMPAAEVPPVSMADFETIRSMNMDPRTSTGLAAPLSGMDDSLSRAASAIDAVQARQQKRMYDGVPPVNMSDYDIIRNMGMGQPQLNAVPPQLAMPSIQPSSGMMNVPQSLGELDAKHNLPQQGPAMGPLDGHGTPAGSVVDQWLKDRETFDYLNALTANQPVDRQPAIQGHLQGMEQDRARLQQEADSGLYGMRPGQRFPLDAGSGAYNDGGRIGHISPEEMQVIMAGAADPRVGRAAGAGRAGSGAVGIPSYGPMANPNLGDLSRIPLPEARVPASVQALAPQELSQLKARLNPTIDLTGAPLQNDAAYPDLLAAARAKLAGQDVVPPTVVGSNRYRGGTAEAQQMQQAAWANARSRRDAMNSDRIGRMENDPLTQYRAARAGNPAAANQVMLNSLGGANSPAGLAALLGGQNAAAVIAQGMDAQGRVAAANAEAEQMAPFMQHKRDADIAAIAQQLMAADPSLTPEQARAKAEALFGAQPVVGAGVVPPPDAQGARTMVGSLLDSLTGIGGWFGNAKQDIMDRALPPIFQR